MKKITYIFGGLLLIGSIASITYLILGQMAPTQEPANGSSNGNFELVDIPPRKNPSGVTTKTPTSTPTVRSPTTSLTIPPPRCGYYCEKAETGTTDWKSFSNDTYGFSIKYPPTWYLTFTETVPELNYFETGILPPDSDDAFYFGRTATGFEDLVSTDETSVTIDSLSATRKVLQDPQDTNTALVLVTFSDQNPAKYHSMFIVYSIAYADRGQIFEKIVGTLRFP